MSSFRQAARVQPRWRQPRRPYARARALSPQQQQAQRVAQAYAGQVPPPYAYPPMALPPHLLARPARRTLRSLLWRNRRQWPAVAWAVTAGFTAGVLRAHHAPVLACLAAGVVPGVLMVLATRRLKREFMQHWWTAAGAAFTVTVPLLALGGGVPWLLLAFLACSAALAVALSRYYRVRPPAEKPPPSTDQVTWRRLAEHNRWNGRLGEPQKIPLGLRYPLHLDGIETHIGDVMRVPMSVAAAWHKPITEAYAEPHADGDPSKGWLTILRQGTLQQTREWDGRGLDADGYGVLGRYADAADARYRLFVPRDGTRHGIVAGSTGSGKTQLLELLVLTDLISGVLPVILDPQNGQSLPHFRGRVPYAAGVEECAEMLHLVYDGMLERSSALAGLEWDDHGHRVRGMPFFDRELTGWPVVHVIADEMPLLLTDSTHGKTAVHESSVIGKLGRKTGVAFWPVAQVPSLSELGDQVVRSMLVGGNVVCLRTGDTVSGGYLRLPADPSELPRQFANGDPTYGLGYFSGPESRQAVMRTDLPTPAARHRHYPVPPMDPVMGPVLARFGRPKPAVMAAAAALPAADDSPAPGGRTAADAVLAVLDRPMEAGAIIRAAQDLSVSWGRPRAFDMKSIRNALAKLKAEGQITQAGERAPYAPAA